MEVICQENVPFRYKTNALTVNKKLLFQLKVAQTLSFLSSINWKCEIVLSDNLDI